MVCVARFDLHPGGRGGSSWPSSNSVGMPTFAIDVCLFPTHDVLDPAIELKILKWITDGRVMLVWAGMPCAMFSRARKYDGRGPGPS